MTQGKNTIFISFSSKDIGKKGYVQAVESAIQHCLNGYNADHMNCGVIDVSVTQRELDKRIKRSRLVIMILDQQYKDCENLRHEFEEVTKKGSKIKVLIFIKECLAPEEIKNQKENIFNVLNISENRYIRFKDPDDLNKNAEIQLNRWHEEKERRKKRRARRVGYAFVAALAGLLFCLLVPYIKSGTEDKLDDIPKHDVVVKESTGKEGEALTGGKGETPTGRKGEIATAGKDYIIVPELPVMAPNTFAVVCDDELFGAGICDAVSQRSPSITQSVDTTKAQWTISVKHSVQDIPKMLESDALQVEVSYIVNLKNNSENGKIITKTIKKRGRSIIQNRDDAIRNANEEATKEIANILNQYKNENI